MTLTRLQWTCLYFWVSDGTEQWRRALSLSLSEGIFLVVAAAAYLTEWPSLLRPTKSCARPRPQGHMILLRSHLWPPTTCPLGFPWIRMSSGPLRCLAGLFLTRLGRSQRRLRAMERGKLWGHLGASRVGLPSCNDIMPRVSYQECDSSIHMIR